MFSIGDFSRITGLSIKALRLYHERGMLVPHSVDRATGYRYYDHANAERARIIVRLRELQFSLDDIESMLIDADDDAETVSFFREHAETMREKLRRDHKILKNLEYIIQNETEALMTMKENEFSVEEKTVETILMAGIRYKGKYSDCGEAFGRIGKRMGGNICGKPFNLYYDADCRDGDADIETCMPVRKGQTGEGLSVRELPGGKCLSLIHKGSYGTIGRSYEKIMAYLKEKGYSAVQPTREIYLKGPGMIFKGNPENYLTEIQIMIEG